MAVKRKFAAGGSTDPQSARKRTWGEYLFGGEDAAVSKAQYKREMNVGKDPKKQVLSSAEVSRSEKSRMNPTQRPYDSKSSPKPDAIKPAKIGSKMGTAKQGPNAPAKVNTEAKGDKPAAAPKKTFDGQFNSPAAKKAAAGRQGLATPVIKPDSTANAGKKGNKPTKQIKQGGYKGNWVNAGPAKKPRSMQEAVRGADAGASFMRGRLTGRNR